MKLELADLIKAVEKVPKPVEASSSPRIPFIDEVGKNVKTSMDILDSIGLKELFVTKAKQEIRKRFKWDENSETISPPGTGNSKQAAINYEYFISLGIVWIRKFIERNGDMKLSEFCIAIEENKGNLIDSIKTITGGMQNNA